MPEQTETTTGQCPGCGTDVEYTPVEVLGKRLSVVPTCPRCTDKEEDRAEGRVPGARDPETDLRRKLDRVGVNVPARGRFPLDHVMDEVGNSVLRRAVARFLREMAAGPHEPVRGLILEGPTGVGKSWVASAMVREVIDREILTPSQIRYDSSRHVWGMIKSGYGDGTASAEITVRMRAGLWVLDDFGAEHANEDTGLNLTEILSARELRPTVMTANVPRESELHEERFDPLVWDRIKSRLGDRNFEVVKVVGPDYRTTA